MTKITAKSISRPTVGLPRKVPLSERLAARLYQRYRRLQGQDAPQAAAPTDSDDKITPVTLACISDTHNTKPADLPPGDILVHAGDLSQYGTFPEIQAQLDWLNTLPYQHKVVIAGNHDLLLDKDFVKAHPDRELDRQAPEGKQGLGAAGLEWGAIRYLQRESTDVVVEAPGGSRTVRFFGSPWSPKCGNWAFQEGGVGGVRVISKGDGAASDTTDILVVHTPPFSHVDNSAGCPELLSALWHTRPRVLVCGHIHAAHGQERLFFDTAQADYEGVMKNKTWGGVLRLALQVLSVWVSTLFKKPAPSFDSTTLVVNAAVVAGRGNRESLPGMSVAI